MSEQQPIKNAPRDGSVILTNDGPARYVDTGSWGEPTPIGWYLCSPNGIIPTCSKEGIAIAFLIPKLWIPLPKWMQP